MRIVHATHRVVLFAISIALAASVLLPGSPEAARAADERALYAVVVGVSKYQDPNVPTLVRSDRDARDFHDFLEERKSLFSDAHLTLLVNEHATRANVARALRQKLSRATKDDIVIIYMSGHGMTDPVVANEFYFGTYDARLDNLFGTALLMNDRNLFKDIKSDNILLLSDACHSGGFNTGLDRLVAKSADRFFSLFDSTRGRIAISSSRPNELSFEAPKFGNSIFTHFLLKGLRGDSVRDKGEPTISVEDLYRYVYSRTKQATRGKQNPQLYAAAGAAGSTPAFLVAKYAKPLDVKVQFFYEADDKKMKPLTNGSSLKSGQHVGLVFRTSSDCYVYIFWRDSNGRMGRLFPNPRLTTGTGHVQGGKTHWLPFKQGERWYVLDDNPGKETIYFVASREQNAKLEDLYRKMATTTRLAAKTASGANSGQEANPRTERTPADSSAMERTKKLSREIEREINLMGFADYSVSKGAQKVSFDTRENLFKDLDGLVRVSGAEAVVKIQFLHVAR